MHTTSSGNADATRNVIVVAVVAFAALVVAIVALIQVRKEHEQNVLDRMQLSCLSTMTHDMDNPAQFDPNRPTFCLRLP